MKQTQADVLRYYKKLVRDAPYKCKMYHVFGHLDEILSISDLTTEELVNICCDQMAEEALRQSTQSHRYISRVFPDEDLVYRVDGVKISGATTPAISRHWGDEQAREHYHSKGIVDRDLFDEVYWDGIEQVMKQSPTMFGVWVTKQVSGFCGTNHMLNTIYGTEADICPNCSATPERATHIFACRDPGRSAVFYSSVDALLEWMRSQKTDPELSALVYRYLRNRGEVPMLSLCRPGSPYRQLAEMQDRLGYRNFLEGRVTALYYSERQLYISNHHLRKHAGHWCKGFIQRLLQITHRQWTYRNRTIHYKDKEGLTAAQQDKIAKECEVFLWTDPMSLLPEDRDLLDMDFEALGEANVELRHIWLSEMQAARAASANVGRMRRRARVGWSDNAERSGPLESSDLGVVVDTEGSLRFRRRKKKASG
jgi:hypothetical protein